MEQTPKGRSEEMISTSFQDTSKQVCERDYKIAGDLASLPSLTSSRMSYLNKHDEEMSSNS